MLARMGFNPAILVQWCSYIQKNLQQLKIVGI